MELKTSSGATVASLDVDAVAGAAAIAKATITAPTPGNYTLVVTKLSTNANYLLGFEYEDSTRSEIRIVQCGVSGAVAADFSVTMNPWDGTNVMKAMAPDFVGISLMINDCVNGTVVGTYGTNLTTVANAFMGSADVALFTSNPVAVGSASMANQLTFAAQVASVAVSTGASLVDVHRRVLGSYELDPTRYTDLLHTGPTGTDILAAVSSNLIATQ